MTSTTNSRRHASGLWLSTLAVLVSALSCARSPVKTSPPPAAVTPGRRTDPTSGTDVVRAMHDKYAGVWYKTLTFSQTTTVTLANGTTFVQQWLEAGEVPGPLRIATDTAESDGGGYSGGNLSFFSHTKTAHSRGAMNEHPLLALPAVT